MAKEYIKYIHTVLEKLKENDPYVDLNKYAFH